MKILVSGVVALMMGVVIAGSASADCSGQEKLNAKCKLQSPEFKLVATMKRGLAGTTVTFTVTDELGNVIHTEDAITGGDGTAKLRIRPFQAGAYTVTVCDVSTTTSCVD